MTDEKKWHAWKLREAIETMQHLLRSGVRFGDEQTLNGESLDLHEQVQHPG